MMYDDIANDPENPTPGILINHPNGSDVYHGVPKDYTGETVTPQNFLKILQGQSMKGIGSGKVIKSGPNDHVFVNFVDHGATGLVAFIDDVLTVSQLNQALASMAKKKQFGKMVIYVEACEAGSMFRQVLPNNINIFATTAANYDESSYACYYDDLRETYLGDVYSVQWMEDSDAENLNVETLQKQFLITRNRTTTSQVEEYGQLSIDTLPVSQFQGSKVATPKPRLPAVAFDAVPSWDVPMERQRRKVAKAAANQNRQSNILLQNSILQEMTAKRQMLETVIFDIVRLVARSPMEHNHIINTHPAQLTKLDCHEEVVQAFHTICFNFGKHPYAMKYAYTLANMCEAGLQPAEIIRVLMSRCGKGPLSSVN